MVKLTRRRIEPWKDRATVEQIDVPQGAPLPVADASYDRFLSNYVFDILAVELIRGLIGEAHRILIPGGKLCLVSLTHGERAFDRFVSFTWSCVHAIHPAIVGGCRPISLNTLLEPDIWRIDHRSLVCRFGVCSE